MSKTNTRDDATASSSIVASTGGDAVKTTTPAAGLDTGPAGGTADAKPNAAAGAAAGDLDALEKSLTDEQLAQLLARRNEKLAAGGRRIGDGAVRTKTGKFIVKSPIKIVQPGSTTGQRYEIGSIVELSPEDAERFLAGPSPAVEPQWI